MKLRILNHLAMGIVLTVLILAPSVLGQGNAFNFQGRLNDGANPANGSYDLQFTLFNSITGGAPIGQTVPRPNTTLINGVFSVNLDFGAAAFNNPNAVFIEIGVKPNGSSNAYTILGPRQQLTVVPYAVRSGTSTNADNAANLNGLNSLDFIRNTTTPQGFTNFNIEGSGVIGGSLAVGRSSVTPNIQLDVVGNVRITGTNNRNTSFGNPNGETGMSFFNGFERADLRMDTAGTIKLVNSLGGIPPDTSGIAIDKRGFVGIGTITPLTRLSLSGGSQWTPSWTASMNLQNTSAIGWEANSSGQRFGIGQGTGGLFFFRTNTPFGQTGAQPSYDMAITDTGNITQPPGKHGLVKAMLYVLPDGTIARCYNALLNSVTGTCGFVVTRTSVGNYVVDLNQPTGFFFSGTSTDSVKTLSVIPQNTNSFVVGITAHDTPNPSNADGAFSLIVY